MPVDPFYEPVADSYFRPAYDDPWYVGVISQGIDAARDVARGALSDYAYPDDPRYRPNVTVYPQPAPPPGPAPQPSPDARNSQSGFSISGNTGLWLIAGLALVVFANRRR